MVIITVVTLLLGMVGLTINCGWFGNRGIDGFDAQGYILCG